MQDGFCISKKMDYCRKMSKWSRLAPTAVALGVYALVRIYDVDIWERLASGLALLDEYEVDELLLVVGGLAAFEYRRHAHRKRLKVYRATAGAAQHVLGNFLQGLQMVKMMARDSSKVSADVLSFCESLVGQATVQLRALSSVERPSERAVWQAVTPKPTSSSPTPSALENS